ncbi:MAG: CSLREA domain-containing protein, partial [Burkholderiales bacterium]|nr:CSLREA domain-containing protein [Burkholderiales bacterium]
MEQRRSFVERAVGAARAALLGVALGVVGVSSHAATITVTSVSDAVNASDGVCTLREA